MACTGIALPLPCAVKLVWYGNNYVSSLHRLTTFCSLLICGLFRLNPRYTSRKIIVVNSSKTEVNINFLLCQNYKSVNIFLPSRH